MSGEMREPVCSDGPNPRVFPALKEGGVVAGFCGHDPLKRLSEFGAAASPVILVEKCRPRPHKRLLCRVAGGAALLRGVARLHRIRQVPGLLPIRYHCPALPACFPLVTGR